MSIWQELAIPEQAEELAIEIRRVAREVHREVGAGFREHVYQQCLAHALRAEGHKVAERQTLNVRFRGLLIAKAGEADMIVDDLVVVELKARETTHPSHRAQLVGYLRATGLPLGLLFNFHAPRLFPEGTDRIVHPRYLQVRS